MPTPPEPEKDVPVQPGGSNVDQSGTAVGKNGSIQVVVPINPNGDGTASGTNTEEFGADVEKVKQDALDELSTKLDNEKPADPGKTGR